MAFFPSSPITSRTATSCNVSVVVGTSGGDIGEADYTDWSLVVVNNQNSRFSLLTHCVFNVRQIVAGTARYNLTSHYIVNSGLRWRPLLGARSNPVW